MNRPPIAALAILLAALVTASASLAAAPAIHNSRFVYSTEEKLGFDLEAYLRDTAPHLLPEAELISHWSAYYTVSPRIVLSLMELQTRQIHGADAGSSNRPFGALSAATSLRQQVQDVLSRLSSLFYESPVDSDGLRVAPAAREALRGLLGSDAAVAKLRSSYGSLFPAERPLDQRAENLATGKAVPPPGLLQLPFPVGESWYFGGAHTTTGDDPGPKSSLDFTLLEGWGDNTSNSWVAAAHGGTVRVYSSCFLEVVGPNGWSTIYYHLDNIVVVNGQTVGRDQRLANYANNRPQAICNGGFANSPHVHFSLLRSNQYIHLQDVQLSRYRVHPGRFSYDWDCGFFWLERGGVRHCAWLESLENDGGVVPPAAPGELTARGLSTTEIRLEWSDRSTDETGFQIERRSAGEAEFQRIATAGANARRWVDGGLASGSTYVYRLRAVNSAGFSEYSEEARATTFIEDPEPCVAADDRLCLAGERFRVEVDWQDFEGNSGRGRVVPFGSADSGLFWFFAEDNWEMLVKVLDACSFNDHYWVFSAATTNVGYTLRVTDTVRGEVREWVNPVGTAAPAVTATTAFAACE